VSWRHVPTDYRLDYCTCGKSWPCPRADRWRLLPHRHAWVPTRLVDGKLSGAHCYVCGLVRRLPTWKYRYFRLRYVDHYGFDDWAFGVALYRNGSRTSEGRPQLGVMFGHREAVFDLPRNLPLPAAPPEN
jgi:hypothetical protein